MGPGTPTASTAADNAPKTMEPRVTMRPAYQQILNTGTAAATASQTFIVIAPSLVKWARAGLAGSTSSAKTAVTILR